MYLKHFTAVPMPVTDPLHPARTVMSYKLVDSGMTGHSHDGVSYEPDANGWFDFPHELAVALATFRQGKSGWYVPGQVGDLVRLGALDQMDGPSAGEPRRGRPRKEQAAD